MKTERKSSSYVLMLGVLGLLVVGSFVAYQVYAAIIKSQITEEQKKAIKPLDGRIEEGVVENLRSRRWFEGGELRQRLIFEVVGDEKIVVEVNEDKNTVATESGVNLESSQEASETGKVEEENEN